MQFNGSSTNKQTLTSFELYSEGIKSFISFVDYSDFLSNIATQIFIKIIRNNNFY